MDAIRIEVSGERQAGLRFEEFPDAIYDDLKAEIEGLTVELYATIRASTPEATGRLQSQVRMRVFAEKDRIKGYIDIQGQKGSQDFAKAGALEYGAHRSAKVASHTMRLDHFWEHKLEAPVSVMVAAYSRTPNISEHSFLRGPLGGMRNEAVGRLNAVVEKATAKANA